MAIESGAKIGAVRGDIQDRILISGLQALSRDDARERGYQTKWPALVPELPRTATQSEIALFTTPNATARDHLIFIKAEEKGLSALKADPLPHGIFVPSDERRRITVAQGIEGYLGIISHTEADRVTSATISYSANPQMKEDKDASEGTFVGIHFDRGEKLSVQDRLKDARRLVVNLGPSPRYSLMIAHTTVLDTAQDLYPGNTEYVPQVQDLLPRIADEARNLQVIWTRLDPGDAYVLPSHVLYHDGSTYGQGPSTTAILFEPPEQWSAEDLLTSHL